jgi:lysophospholipase L1-like esterase
MLGRRGKFDRSLELRCLQWNFNSTGEKEDPMFRKTLSRKRTLLLAVVAVVCAPLRPFAQQASPWVGTWANGPDAFPEPSGSQTAAATTFRNVVYTSIAGTGLRIKLTNELGLDPLTIGGASIASNAGGGAIMAGTSLPVTFAGQPSVTLPPGTAVISDPVAMTIPAFSSLSVDVYVPQQTVRTWTFHQVASSTNYQAPGDQLGATTLSGSTTSTSWYLLKTIDVEAPGAVAVVTIGDSITDGQGSTQDANHRWPDYLAARLATAGGTSPIAVLNAGIAGNHILNSSANGGLNTLARLDRDALTQSGAKYVIIFEGINDIFKPTTPPATVAQITAGLAQVVARGHELGLTVYGATITPTDRLSSAEQQMRTAVNQWIRTSGVYDGYFDFDLVVQNPANPIQLLRAYDSGDHLHPNDAGYSAMASSINLALFGGSSANVR